MLRLVMLFAGLISVLCHPHLKEYSNSIDERSDSELDEEKKVSDHGPDIDEISQDGPLKDFDTVLKNVFGSKSLLDLNPFSFFSQLPGLGIMELGKKIREEINSGAGSPNETSITKVINGHKVQVNESKYETAGGNGVVHFQIMKIAPVTDDKLVQNFTSTYF